MFVALDVERLEEDAAIEVESEAIAARDAGECCCPKREGGTRSVSVGF